LILRREAVAILAAAKRGEGVSAECAQSFARAVMQLSDVGRVALAVLDGGLFTGARLVELADLVLRDVQGDARDADDGKEVEK
jgi:hypothetical protein